MAIGVLLKLVSTLGSPRAHHLVIYCVMVFSSPTVLVTGAGAPGITGTIHALRNNPSGQSPRIIGCDMHPSAVGQELIDAFATALAPEDDHYLEMLLCVCREHGVDVVLPQTTREVQRLAAARDCLRSEGVALVAGQAEAVRRGNDKVETLEAFEAVGLVTPRWSLARSVEQVAYLAVEFGYPELEAVVKLPRGNGMRGFRVLSADARRYEDFANSKPGDPRITLDEFLKVLATADDIELLVMEYLPGVEYSVDCYRGPSGDIAVVRKRTSVRSGIAFDTVVVDRPDVGATALRGAEELGLDGVFGFQFKESRDGSAMLLECNPRVQGTMVASVLAGANIIWAAVNDALGRPPISIPAPRIGTRLRRYWGGVDDIGNHISGPA